MFTDLSYHRTGRSAYGGSYFGCHSRYAPIKVAYFRFHLTSPCRPANSSIFTSLHNNRFLIVTSHRDTAQLVFCYGWLRGYGETP